MGSAAVFFHLRPKRALLSDVNHDLVNAYAVMRRNPKRLQEILTWHHENHGHDHYYKIRSKKYADKIWRAARFIYLNRTCWNGLYRVNQRGEFNVPIGTKTAVTFANEDFTEYSSCLAAAELACQDFEKTIDASVSGDFLFADPPYTVRRNMNGFLKYNESIFSWDDQIRLATALRRAADRGVAIVVTNADHDCVRELYEGRFSYDQKARHSVLAGSSAHRGVTTEAVFAANL